jgi:hypothetical protein
VEGDKGEEGNEEGSGRRRNSREEAGNEGMKITENNGNIENRLRSEGRGQKEIKQKNMKESKEKKKRKLRKRRNRRETHGGGGVKNKGGG